MKEITVMPSVFVMGKGEGKKRPRSRINALLLEH